MTEIDKLEKYLSKHGYEYIKKPLFGGEQIKVYANDKQDWDVICHPYSFGYEKGLLEIMGPPPMVDPTVTADSVEGWLTAEEIIKRLEARDEPKN